MTEETHRLRQVISGWFEARREAYLEAARASGILPSVRIPVAVATNVDAHHTSVDWEYRNVSPLFTQELAFMLDNALASTPPIGTPPVADVLEFVSSDALPWGIFNSEDRDRDANRLLDAAARDYLAALDSLETADARLAEEHAAELVDLLAAETVVLVTALPVGGLTVPEEPIDIGEFRLRRLTPEELGRLFEAGMMGTARPAPRRTVRRLRLDGASERAVLETRVRCAKNAQPTDALLPHRAVLALQLLGFELHGSGGSTAWTEPGPSTAVGNPFISIAEVGTSERECSEDELRHAAALAAVIPEGAIWNPRTRVELVLHRFKLGATERSQVDSVVDYVVALESFLLGEKEGEYRFKFGLFGAWYLGSNVEEREAIARDLREIYDVRSEIVHGSIPNNERIAEIARRARDLAARMIIKALESGWPSHDQLRKGSYG